MGEGSSSGVGHPEVGTGSNVIGRGGHRSSGGGRRTVLEVRWRLFDGGEVVRCRTEPTRGRSLGLTVHRGSGTGGVTRAGGRQPCGCRRVMAMEERGGGLEALKRRTGKKTVEATEISGVADGERGSVGAMLGRDLAREDDSGWGSTMREGDGNREEGSGRWDSRGKDHENDAVIEWKTITGERIGRGFKGEGVSKGLESLVF